jgi:hypothetical protein
VVGEVGVFGVKLGKREKLSAKMFSPPPRIGISSVETFGRENLGKKKEGRMTHTVSPKCLDNLPPNG